jgi:hypothetical protein
MIRAESYNMKINDNDILRVKAEPYYVIDIDRIFYDSIE